MNWIKLHFDEDDKKDAVYVQTSNICCVFVGNDGKTHITLVGDDTNWFMVAEPMEEVLKLLDIVENVEIEQTEEKKDD